jgi:hypothetical protein
VRSLLGGERGTRILGGGGIVKNISFAGKR